MGSYKLQSDYADNAHSHGHGGSGDAQEVCFVINNYYKN